MRLSAAGSDGGRLDFERLRSGQSRFDRDVPDLVTAALPSFLGRVVSVAANIRAGRFCKVVPASVLGDERERAVGVLSDRGEESGSRTILVQLLGSFLPTSGSHVVCRFVDHRWVAELTGGRATPGQGVLLPSCFCLVPPVLQMHSAEPRCNYGMFQSCSLTYGPPPAALVELNFASEVFTSGQSFVDPITRSRFFYYFWCQYNQFFLTRIFPTSPFGSPYRDGILYSWIVGGYGNTCEPFQLETGAPFPGSDTTCSVSISGG